MFYRKFSDTHIRATARSVHPKSSINFTGGSHVDEIGCNLYYRACWLCTLPLFSNLREMSITPFQPERLQVRFVLIPVLETVAELFAWRGLRRSRPTEVSGSARRVCGIALA